VAYAENPAIAPTWPLDFTPTHIRLLTATCIGLLTEVTSTNIDANVVRASP